MPTATVEFQRDHELDGRHGTKRTYRRGEREALEANEAAALVGAGICSDPTGKLQRMGLLEGDPGPEAAQPENVEEPEEPDEEEEAPESGGGVAASAARHPLDPDGFGPIGMSTIKEDEHAVSAASIQFGEEAALALQTGEAAGDPGKLAAEVGRSDAKAETRRAMKEALDKRKREAGNG